MKSNFRIFSLLEIYSNTIKKIPDRLKFIISQNEQAAISSILRNYVQQNEYDEAGNIMKTIHQATDDNATTEVSQKRYRYCGKERDEESGLYYYSARYYAAWLCRFVSVDPLKDDYPYYSPFQYAGNKPISYIDLDGLEEVKLTHTATVKGILPTLPLVLGSESMSYKPEIRIAADIEAYSAQINMEYTVIDDGNAGISDFDSTVFSNQYSKGNTSFFTNSLQPGKIKPVKNGKFLLNVEYNYGASENGDIKSAIQWHDKNPKGRGLAFGMFGSQIPQVEYKYVEYGYSPLKDSTLLFDQPKLILGMENGSMSVTQKTINPFDPKNKVQTYYQLGMTGLELLDWTKLYPKRAFIDPSIGGIATYSKILIKNFFAVNLSTSMTTSNTMISVHEAGHNAAENHKHNTGLYEYDQKGLQSNGPNPYPTLQNTLSILNDPINR